MVVRARLATMSLALCLGQALGGCSLYYGGASAGDPPPPCAAGAPQPMRDPVTGLCDYYGGSTCPNVGIAEPLRFLCDTACDPLDEPSCLKTAGCHAAYAVASAAAVPEFFGCFDTRPLGPREGGACASLDPFGCLAHDDCSAVYVADPTGDAFQRCMPEPSPSDPCAGVACPGGSACTATCDAAGTCAATCAPIPQACDALTDEMSCLAHSCRPVYRGSNCSCDPTGCTCQQFDFDRCEAPQCVGC
jgi:hypothetical protein